MYVYTIVVKRVYKLVAHFSLFLAVGLAVLQTSFASSIVHFDSGSERQQSEFAQSYQQHAFIPASVVDSGVTSVSQAASGSLVSDYEKECVHAMMSFNLSSNVAFFEGIRVFDHALILERQADRLFPYHHFL